MPNIFKSSLQILSSHFMSIVLSFFGMLVFSWAYNFSYGAIIYNIIMLFIYISFIYSAAWRMGVKDARKIEGYYPDIRKSVKTAFIASVPSLILFAGRVVVPFIWGNYVGTYADLIYRLWFFAYIGFFSDGNNFIAYVFPLFIIPVCTIAGYSVGLKKFSIFDKIYPKLIYKRTDKKVK